MFALFFDKTVNEVAMAADDSNVSKIEMPKNRAGFFLHFIVIDKQSLKEWGQFQSMFDPCCT